MRQQTRVLKDALTESIRVPCPFINPFRGHQLTICDVLWAPLKEKTNDEFIVFRAMDFNVIR